MRRRSKFILLAAGVIMAAGGVLFACGILSVPRDFSSPPTSIHIVDRNGAPLTGLEVSRDWYDDDCNKDGSDEGVTDATGVCRFPKVAARVGLFTGAWRKIYTHFGICGSGSGTYTTIYVRYSGRYNVFPTAKSLRGTGQSQQDNDGVWFTTDVDNLSNTLIILSFPAKTKIIDYSLTSKPESNNQTSK